MSISPPTSSTGAPPAPAAPAKGQPFGSSPATGPTQNAGQTAAGLQIVGMLINGISKAIPMVGAASEVGRVLVEFLPKLTKLVPAGSVTPAAEKNAMDQMRLQAAQAGPQMAAMRQSAAAQPQGGSSPAAPGA